MPEQVRLSESEARGLIAAALTGAGTSGLNSRYLTEAILDTELSGLEGHGFYWLQFYCQHLQSGKVDGNVRPRVRRTAAGSFRVDARNGFAHPAIEAGFRHLLPAAKAQGVAAMTVHNSYNAATLGFHTGTLARQGLLAFGFTNAVPTIAPVGGRDAVVGTNPMSVAVPGGGGKIAFLVDQSASAVPWTSIKRAAEDGREIPLGWALNKHGEPTTSAASGLEGTMAPAGGIRGFSQALIVEVMCAALGGANLAPRMGSFVENDGKPIGCGQAFIALDPDRFAGRSFQYTIRALAKSITSQQGARLPNSRREANRRRNERLGLLIDAELLGVLRNFARLPDAKSRHRPTSTS